MGYCIHTIDSKARTALQLNAGPARSRTITVTGTENSRADIIISC